MVTSLAKQLFPVLHTTPNPKTDEERHKEVNNSIIFLIVDTFKKCNQQRISPVTPLSVNHDDGGLIGGKHEVLSIGGEFWDSRGVLWWSYVPAWYFVKALLCVWDTSITSIYTFLDILLPCLTYYRIS